MAIKFQECSNGKRTGPCKHYLKKKEEDGMAYKQERKEKKNEKWLP